MPSIQGSYAQSGVSRYVSQAAEETKIVKTSPGLLLGLVVTNVKATDIFLFMYDSATAAGTLLGAPIKIPGSIAGNPNTIRLPLDAALPFNTGLTFASSSTGGTYTATVTADLMLAVDYK